MKCADKMTQEERDRFIEIAELRAEKLVGSVKRSTLCPICGSRFAIAAVMKAIQRNSYMAPDDLLRAALEAFSHVTGAAMVETMDGADFEIERLLRDPTGGSVH